MYKDRLTEYQYSQASTYSLKVNSTSIEKGCKTKRSFPR